MTNMLVKVYLFLHIMLLIYSTAGIFSKMAAGQMWGSASFALCYAAMLVVLAIYALGWQQVIKHLPLSVAFAHRAIIIVWGMVWGYIVFGEYITIKNIIGVIVIMLGIVVYSSSEKIENGG